MATTLAADPIRIYILEDQVLFRETLAEFLATCQGMEVVGRAGEGEEALLEMTRLKPDLVLMDVSLPTIDGLDVCRRIKAIAPDIRVIVVTAYSGADVFVRAVEAGADGFMLKDESLENVVATIRRTHQGTSMSRNRRLPQSVAGWRTEPGSQLTRREIQILKAVAVGRDNRAIAAELHIGEKTVRNHISNIYDKLSVQGRAQAVLYAVDNALA